MTATSKGMRDIERFYWRPWDNYDRWRKFRNAAMELFAFGDDDVVLENPAFWDALIRAAALAQEIRDEIDAK